MRRHRRAPARRGTGGREAHQPPDFGSPADSTMRVPWLCVPGSPRVCRFGPASWLGRRSPPGCTLAAPRRRGHPPSRPVRPVTPRCRRPGPPAETGTRRGARRAGTWRRRASCGRPGAGGARDQAADTVSSASIASSAPDAGPHASTLAAAGDSRSSRTMLAARIDVPIPIVNVLAVAIENACEPRSRSRAHTARRAHARPPGARPAASPRGRRRW